MDRTFSAGWWAKGRWCTDGGRFALEFRRFARGGSRPGLPFAQDGLEKLKVLVEDFLGFVENDQEQAGLVDEGIGFHFSQVFDDGVAPLAPVTAVALIALAELVGDFDFQP